MTEENRNESAKTCENQKIYCCPHCGAPLGSTNGRELTIGAVLVRDSIRLKCVACHQSYEWHPETEIDR